jgi:hypothetical protein
MPDINYKQKQNYLDFEYQEMLQCPFKIFHVIGRAKGPMRWGPGTLLNAIGLAKGPMR